MKKLAVIILNWNGRKLLEQFIPTAVKHTSDDEVDLIVADNGSDDDSLTWLEKNHPEVKTIRLEKNYGFAEGYNRAIEATRYPFTILLNSDVEVTPGWWRPLLRFLESNPDAGAKPDMVFPNAPTAVTEAARHKNLPMVRWLIEQGADITIADKYGDRPYTVAVQNKNQEMADYLKALEPEEWHNEQEKIRQLMPYKLPAKLVEYLKTGPLRLEFPDQEWVKWAELYSFMDVQEMTWKRKKLLSLMVQMDNYSDYLLLWSPRDKKLWYLDIEHEEFHPLAKWDDFIADPGRYLNGMIEGEFEE